MTFPYFTYSFSVIISLDWNFYQSHQQVILKVYRKSEYILVLINLLYKNRGHENCGKSKHTVSSEMEVRGVRVLFFFT